MLTGFKVTPKLPQVNDRIAFFQRDTPGFEWGGRQRVGAQTSEQAIGPYNRTELLTDPAIPA